MDKNTWISIASLFFTLLFGFKGWITMNGIIEFINELNPWKVGFFAFFIIFLGSVFISMWGKYREFKKDYRQTRKLIYQLFDDSERREIKKAIETAVRNGVTEAKTEWFPKSDKNAI